MISLFLDTSSNYLTLGLIKDNQVLKTIHELLANNLSKITLSRIDELLKEYNYQASDIDEIVCVSGPGSFTGLRIGITIAKTYAYGLNKKLYSVSKLYAMACSIKDKAYKVPIIDARHGHVYGAVYDANNNLILEEQYMAKEALLKFVEELASPNYAYISEEALDFPNLVSYQPDLEEIFKEINFKEEDYMQMVPNYLKDPEAFENLQKKLENKE